MHPEPSDPGRAPAAPADARWQPLPPRARALMMLSIAGVCLPVVPAAAILAGATDVIPPWVAIAATLPAALLIAAWRGARQFAAFGWRLDGDGLAVRRGTLWQSEVHVPATRVQHLDVKRGPLQRRRALSTLVVHTAGTRQSAVTVAHLDADDAERLRDALARRIADVDD
jgi:hypothetical protein